ncbi:MAG: polyhydroxyalkanoic acid system family protein [Porticoccaceae bacterium]|nr:polyhydroxyalkanoic acid system family protein [Porticoccaceae bacterium]
MSTISFKRNHTMTSDQLRQEVQALADKLIDKFGGSAAWQEDEMHYEFNGGIKACVACKAEEVQVEVELEGMMSLFKGRIASEVEDYLQRHIS